MAIKKKMANKKKKVARKSNTKFKKKIKSIKKKKKVVTKKIKVATKIKTKKPSKIIHLISLILIILSLTTFIIEF